MTNGDVFNVRPGSLHGFGQRHRLSVPFDVDVAAAITRLSDITCPFAIIWRVVAVHVFALQGHAIRTRPHVGEEPREVVAPFTAHLNASRAVVFVADVFSVIAASLRRLPRHVLSGICVSVGSYSCASALVSPTSATDNLSGSQRLTRGCRWLTARAQTQPSTRHAAFLGSLSCDC